MRAGTVRAKTATSEAKPCSPHAKRTALCPAGCSLELLLFGRAIVLHVDLADKYPSREGFPHPCGAPGGEDEGGKKRGMTGSGPREPHVSSY